MKENQILSLKKDIKKLNEIIEIYETTENLYGGFYTDFISEVESQIDFLKNCIINLQNLEK